MPRFPNAFTWRKSTADELQIAQTSPDQPSFRVLERNPPSEARTFDGGVRLNRAGGPPLHKPTNSELEPEDNIFAGLNSNRGSSNTTKATSTDASSRHSNASTAPSSADIPSAHDDRGGKRKMAKETTPRPLTKSSTSSFLDRAGRTFSFGGQKKNTVPPPNQDPVPDMPSIPVFQREDEYGRTRALTASTTSTATPPKLDEGSTFDMGGDFGSMFTSFDKRASMATLRNDGANGQSPGQRQGQPTPLNLDTTTRVEPSPASWNSQNSKDNLMGPSVVPGTSDRPPPVPRHQPSFEYRSSHSPEGVVEDEDAKLLADSVMAGRFLSDGPRDDMQTGRYRRDEDHFSAAPRQPIASDFDREDNMFEGTTQRFARPSNAAGPQSEGHGTNKVMTPAEFERYRLDKEREGLQKAANNTANNDEDDEDEINYDDEEDEEDKLKRQAKQRRSQQASMAAYRQRNMKTTGELRSTSPLPLARPGLPTSLSAPHLGVAKTPSPEPARLATDEDEDEDVPLAILQAHGFPSKGRQPNRLSSVGSNPNLRASTFMSPARPSSTLGEPISNIGKRHSTLPAFARNLPQDPFVGASISRPAMRESLAMGGGSQTHLSPHPPQHAPMQPGGLVGVIANEERSRAMRRGSPNMESQRLMGTAGGIDPINGIPPQMMYGAGPQGMGNMPGMQRGPQPLSVGDQAQLQMTQQMSQFMEMQMQFMQMMASSQQGGSPQQMMQQQQMQQQMQQQQMPQLPYGGFPATQSVADFSSAQSIMGGQPPQPRRMDPSMRTMSMIQPSTSSFMQNGFSSPAMGYTPSIAPSERSNVGLPGRYRPVSQAGSAVGHTLHPRSQSMSGTLTLSQADDTRSKSTMKIVSTPRGQNNSDDDDEEGWEVMRAKRDQKKSKWRFKKRTEDVY